MQAQVGDDVAVGGRRVDDGDRHGTIIEVHGEGGTPPYLVRWDDGRESLFFPASGTRIEHPSGSGRASGTG